MKFKLGKRTRFRELKVGDWFVTGRFVPLQSVVLERIKTTRTKRNARFAANPTGYAAEWTLDPSVKVYPIEVAE